MAIAFMCHQRPDRSFDWIYNRNNNRLYNKLTISEFTDDKVMLSKKRPTVVGRFL